MTGTCAGQHQGQDQRIFPKGQVDFAQEQTPKTVYVFPRSQFHDNWDKAKTWTAGGRKDWVVKRCSTATSQADRLAPRAT